ncbi:MAG: sulfur carrier protein ThiS adenylyltransferase ThiF [Bacteroidales bacterium]|nr:sulfur carrier protein ThiS adenylyltransferase ThiF [Bacteroidales bacterium]
MKKLTFNQIKEALSTKTVGIAGCGGLGSNCAIALARVGIGTLIIVDFDVISEGNLNRQYFFRDQIGTKKVLALQDNISRINPLIKIQPHDLRLTSANIPVIFNGCDVVIEAFDLADQKQLFIETILTEMPSIPLVVGLGMAGWGENDTIHLRQSDNLYICGDEVTEIAPDCPPLAPRVGIVANMQANVTMELLLNGVKQGL